MKKIIFLMSVLSLAALGCDKDSNDEITNIAATGNIRLMIEHMSADINNDTTSFELDSMAYVTTENDTFEIKSIKYFISNVKLVTVDNDTVSALDSYHLIEQNTTQRSSEIMKNISGIPVGSYNKLIFSIGIDSASNNVDSIDQHKGDLFLSGDMEWKWETGFKFMKLEGLSNTNGNSVNKELLFHIGNNANYKTITKSIPLTTIEDNGTVMIHIITRIDKMFSGVDFDTSPKTAHASSPLATQVANNYATMFEFHHRVNILP